MGARKGKGCRSNIWILNGIIHETLKNRKMKPVLLQFYDYKQMFDSIDLKEAISDIYEYGVKDDTLQLIFKANEQIHMAVKTPGGLTEQCTPGRHMGFIVGLCKSGFYWPSCGGGWIRISVQRKSTH